MPAMPFFSPFNRLINYFFPQSFYTNNTFILVWGETLHIPPASKTIQPKDIKIRTIGSGKKHFIKYKIFDEFISHF